MNHKYILVNGYTATGSSAVIDLLKECRNTYIPEHEFRLLVDPFGIIDLDREINNSVDVLNDDVAIKCCLWFLKKYCKKGYGLRSLGLNYADDYGAEIYKAIDSYINGLTNFEYDGWWWYLSLNESFFKMMIYKVLRRLHIYDFRKHSKMRLVTISEDKFLELTRKFINDIFEPTVNELDTIVLDQAIPANFPGYGARYFESAKVINVERDARDVYIHLINQEKRGGAIIGHVGLEISKTHNVQLFIDWFKKYRRPGLAGKSLNLYFEDLIYDFEKTKDRIFEYVGFKESDHIYPHKYLQIEKSIKNTGIWKSYPNQEEIRKIEKALPEFLYGGE